MPDILSALWTLVLLIGQIATVVIGGSLMLGVIEIRRAKRGGF